MYIQLLVALVNRHVHDMFLWASKQAERSEWQFVSTTFPRNEFERHQRDTLFLAIKPDEEAVRRIYQLAEKIKHARGFEGDLIDRKRLHTTLFFLGPCEGFSEEMIARIHRAAVDLKAAPFEVTFDRTMSFLNRRDNYAFVLVGDAGVDRLRAFHRLLGVELTRNGLRRWVRTILTPHVTLLYDQRIVDEQPIEPISWMVREVLLVRSLYGQQKHINLARWQLRG
jgi:2'-5' RNA ligase